MRDVVQRDAEALLGEQLAGGVEDSLPIALGIAAKGLVGLGQGDAETLARSGLTLSGFLLGFC
jgi:hypothetical protein